jgi:hypothetical protein
MQEKIILHIHEPEELENLYQSNQELFTDSFQNIYPLIKENNIAQVWFYRLQNSFSNLESKKMNKSYLFIIIVSCILACCIVKFPIIFNLKEDVFFAKNISFLVFPFMCFYFLWKNKDSFKKYVIVFSIILISVVYINLVFVDVSDTIFLSQIHLPLFIWSLVGISFVGNNYKSEELRLNFLRLNGNVIIMGGLLFIASLILAGITISLFGLIGINIEKFYFENIFQWMVVSIPLVSLYIVQLNPKLVNKISPLIAKIFSPLVLITLLVYLGAIIYSNKNPYNNREFLMIFNGLILGVLVIIAFSVAEHASSHKNNWELIILLALTTVTIIINIIAVSAVVMRINEQGITPNRIAVLVGNILMFVHLILISKSLWLSLKEKGKVKAVENAITSFLPVYIIWTVFVIFILPLLFNFK